MTDKEVHRIVDALFKSSLEEAYRAKVGRSPCTPDDLEDEGFGLFYFGSEALEELAIGTHIDRRTGRSHIADVILDHAGLTGQVGPTSEAYRTLADEGHRAYAELLERLEGELSPCHWPSPSSAHQSRNTASMYS